MYSQSETGNGASIPREPKTTAARPRVVISINSSWNIFNFRAGLIRALINEGYDIIAAAPHDTYSAKLEAMGCRFVPVSIDNKGANPVRDLALLARYHALFRRERPIAFLGYTIKPNVFGSLAAHQLATPVINNISGLGTAFISDTWLTFVVKRLYRASLRSSQRVFFQNEEDRSLFVDLRLVRSGQTDVLPGSGIDLARFTPVHSKLLRHDKPRRFLLIARLLWDKGIGEYVAAARLVRSQHPETTFGLLGFLDVENRTAISQADVEGWVKEGVIEYLGVSDDVRPFIADADCVVLPSYREGTPRTLLEAAAMGKPLIATDVPGCRDVVNSGENGFLCRVRDSADLAAQVLGLIALPHDRVAALGRASRAKVERDYDERIVIDRYLAILEEIRTRDN